MTKIFFIAIFFLSLCLSAQKKLSHADSVQKVADAYYKGWIEENAKRQAAGLKPLPLKDTSFNIRKGQAEAAVELKEIRINPQFPDNTKEFIANNLVKPKDSVPGKVFIRLTVLPNGNVSNVIVLKGLNSSCNKAAVDIVKKLPKFKPALDTNNKPTSCDVVIPVVFN